jgi:hypothetical protein
MDECITMGLGPIDKRVLKKLQDSAYDQAPVETPNIDIGWRLVRTADLRKLSFSGKTLDEDPSNFIPDDLVRLPDIDHLHIALPELLGYLVEHPSFLFYSLEPAPDFEDTWPGNAQMFRMSAESLQLFGLVTISDLNKPVIRKVIYDIFFELEIGLAQLARHSFASSTNWIRLLKERAQIQVLGNIGLMKDRGCTIDPLSTLEFSQLREIASKSRALRELLNFKSQNAFDEATDALPDLRNRTMHPVRPLVTSNADPAKLRKHVDSAIDLQARIQLALNRQRQTR